MAKNKSKNKNKPQGAQLFDEFHKKLYGAELWPKLKEALLANNLKVSLLNPFDEKSEVVSDAEDISGVKVSAQSLSGHYELDPASVVVVTALDLNEGDRVLDLCAAPGGKALSLMYRAKGRIELTCNELSLPRFKRLRSVLRDHLPQDIYETIHFKKSDGSRFGLFNKEAFDQVLLDAPCSGERHLLHSKSDLDVWTEKRAKGLHQRQVALICSGFDCLKPGGSLVYSTCSINPLENDAVIEKLLKKRPQAEIQKLEMTYGTDTELGHLILPLEKNWGPIYVAKVKKSDV